jgi:hypothetical protein
VGAGDTGLVGDAVATAKVGRGDGDRVGVGVDATAGAGDIGRVCVGG